MKRRPILFSSAVILLIYLLNKIPLSDILQQRGYTDFNANAIEDILFNSFVIICVSFIILKQHIPFSLSNRSYAHATYYVPLLLYLIVFSGGLSGFGYLSSSSIKVSTLLLYFFDCSSSAFLEEIVFRGLILGLLLHQYNQFKNGVLRSVLISSLIFGGIHILNLWSLDGHSLKGVFNQIYATIGLGFMYGAIYLKTRSIITLSVIHLLSNFFAGLSELETRHILENTAKVEPSLMNSVFAEIFRLVIFGIPLLIGLFVVKQVHPQDIELLLKKNEQV